MSKDDIWKKYKETKDNVYKHELIESYVYLIKIVAGRMYNYHGGKVEYNDLVSYGIFGLIDAIEKFDIDRNLKFDTYAQIRIRGAIIDNLRKIDWIPRSLRKKSKEVEEAVQRLENKLGRSPEIDELASDMKLRCSEVEDLLSQIATFNVVSLDELLTTGGDTIPDDDFWNEPHHEYETKEIKRILRDTINKLPYKEKVVVSMYYYDELTYKEIAKVLELSESRISQLHSKAIVTITNNMGKVGLTPF